MTFEKMPCGVNLTAQCYNQYRGWYAESEDKEGCCGCMERAGKQILVAPAHLINALLIAPIMMIYDLAMAVFFLIANLCTAFVFDELRERLLCHLYSAGSAPFEAFRNLMAALWPPAAYRGEDGVAVNYAMNGVDSIRNACINALEIARNSDEDFISDEIVDSVIHSKAHRMYSLADQAYRVIGRNVEDIGATRAIRERIRGVGKLTKYICKRALPTKLYSDEMDTAVERVQRLSGRMPAAVAEAEVGG